MDMLIRGIDEDTYFRLVVLKIKSKCRTWKELLIKVSKLKPEVLLEQQQ